MHLSKSALAATAATASLALAVPAFAAPQVSTGSLRSAVTYAGVREHLVALQAIANANVFQGNPTRATGTPGHEESVEYVVGRLSDAGYNVRLQPFEADIFFEQAPAVFQQVAPNSITYPRYDGASGVWYTADFSGDGDVTAEAVAVDFAEPTATASTSTSGCESADFGPAVVGKIVLLQRGTCDFGLKVENAQAAGALAAVIFNEGTLGDPDRNGIVIPTLEGYHATIPVIGTAYPTGRSLVDLDRAGVLRLRVKVDGFVDQDVQTNNVIAESTAGRADRTVVVGGHLDSVHEGPGINDNGSGVAVMLETAEEISELGLTPRNKLRFIFFSGEEQGLFGSDYYVSQLTKKQRQSISAMLNFDMLGSPNFARFVYDGDGSEFGLKGPNGSGVIEQVFAEWYDSRGLVYEETAFDGRSDYDAFTAAGIPAGGLFSGAEEIKSAQQVNWYGGTAGMAYDPCYHQACDTLSNISQTGLTQHKNAAVHAIWTFARTTSDVNGTAQGTPTKATDWDGDRLLR